MSHTNVRFKDVPICVQDVFGCSDNMKRILQAHLEAGDYIQLVNTLDRIDIDIWLPSCTDIGPIDGVLLCKKNDTFDKFNDNTLWLPIDIK